MNYLKITPFAAALLLMAQLGFAYGQENAPSGNELKTTLKISDKIKEFEDAPDSCESLYYNLFANPVAPKARPKVTNAAIRKATMAAVASVNKILSRVATSDPLFSPHTELMGEWVRRAERITWVPDQSPIGDGTSTQAVLFPCGKESRPGSASAAPPGRLCRADRLAKAGSDGTGIFQTRSLGVGFDGSAVADTRNGDTPAPVIATDSRFVGRSLAANIFWVGHEVSHSIYWAPPELVSCLASPQSLGARTQSHPIDEDRFLELLQKMPPKGGGFRQGFGTELIPFFEDIYFSGDAALASEFLALLSKSEKQPWTAEDGRVLQRVLNLRPRDLKWRRDLRDSVKMGLMEQSSEAVADYMGTLEVTAFIKQNYKSPAEQKAAALEVLKTFPPHLFKPSVQQILSQVGTKKSNEERVFRILLANPEFRDLLGCTFKTQPAPKFCGRYQAAAADGARGPDPVTIVR